jgi:hypothetical protein
MKKKITHPKKHLELNQVNMRKFQKELKKQKLARQYDRIKDQLTVEYYENCNKVWERYQNVLRKEKL